MTDIWNTWLCRFHAHDAFSSPSIPTQLNPTQLNKNYKIISMKSHLFFKRREERSSIVSEFRNSCKKRLDARGKSQNPTYVLKVIFLLFLCAWCTWFQTCMRVWMLVATFIILMLAHHEMYEFAQINNKKAMPSYNCEMDWTPDCNAPLVHSFSFLPVPLCLCLWLSVSLSSYFSCVPLLVLLNLNIATRLGVVVIYFVRFTAFGA